jgi:hypothetical protein
MRTSSPAATRTLGPRPRPRTEAHCDEDEEEVARDIRDREHHVALPRQGRERMGKKQGEPL